MSTEPVAIEVSSNGRSEKRSSSGCGSAALRVATRLAPMVQLAKEMQGEDEEMHSRLISEWTVRDAASLTRRRT